MGKDGKNSKCPANVDPTDPIVLLSLVKTAVNQSNEIFLHNDPQVQVSTPYKEYIKQRDTLQGHLDQTMDCIQHGKVFSKDFMEDLRGTLQKGVPRTDTRKFEKRVQRELEKLAEEQGEESE